MNYLAIAILTATIVLCYWMFEFAHSCFEAKEGQRIFRYRGKKYIAFEIKNINKRYEIIVDNSIADFKEKNHLEVNNENK